MRTRFIWKNNGRLVAIGFTLRLDQPDAFFDRGSNNLKLSASTLISIVVHVVALLLLAWALKQQLIKPRVEPPPPLRVSLGRPQPPAPPPAPALEPQPLLPTTPEPVPAPVRHLLTAPAKRPNTPSVRTAPEQPLPPLPPPPAPNPNAAPQEDMLSHINARHQQLAAEDAREMSIERGESDDEIGKARALANLAATSKPADQVQSHGGEFEMRRTGLHEAEFTFHGWNDVFRRNTGVEYTVEQGNEPTIELAVIDKYIEIIREHEKGDFVWESQRTHRTTTLSARPQDNAALRAFLFKDLYPNLPYPLAGGDAGRRANG